MKTFDFLSELSTWPCDCQGQIEFVDRLRTLLAEASSYYEENSSVVLTIDSSSEPTQSQWEALWVLETGRALPITAAAQLIWWNTLEDELGGFFGAVRGDGTVYRREHIWPKGGSIVYEVFQEDTSGTINTAIGADNTLLPGGTFTLPTACDVYLEFRAGVDITSAGTLGVDFLLDGAKVGTTYEGLSVDHGIFEFADDTVVNVHYKIPNTDAGTYDIQVIMGRTSTSTAVAGVGGNGSGNNLGVLQLVVRGVVI